MDLGLLGASLVMGISATGSAIAIGMCGQANIGAWKKCFAANKSAPMTLLAFTGNPLTQVFYGYILMGVLKSASLAGTSDPTLLLGFGIIAGVAIAFSAIVQGKSGAAACDAIVETGKGFAQFIAIMGIAETIALFTMVLTMTSLSV